MAWVSGVFEMSQHTTVEFQKPDIRLKVVLSISGLVFLVVLAFIFRSTASLIFLGLGVVGVSSLGVNVWFKYQIYRHELRERESNTIVIEQKAQQEILITEQLKLAMRLHETRCGVFVHGGFSEWTFVPATAGERKELLPSPNVIEQVSSLDLLTVFTQPTQSYACIGGQQTGKTFQMRHIAHYWVQNDFKPIVVGPKWDKGEWAGCLLFGGQGNFAEVEKGITIVRQEAQRRHADDRRHKDHSILPVFFDDWTPIVDAVSNAREMVLQATTLYASVNIILYFILHSDTSNAWGVDRKGAALKDNFIKLFIVPHYDSSGLIVRDKTTGYIKFAGDNQEYPVKLFNTPLSPMLQAGNLETPDYINLEVQPTVIEAEILRLFHEESEPVSAIAEIIYGSKGGNQNEQVKRILEKFAGV
jgi:hypothetical protein